MGIDRGSMKTNGKQGNANDFSLFAAAVVNVLTFVLSKFPEDVIAEVPKHTI